MGQIKKEKRKNIRIHNELLETTTELNKSKEPSLAFIVNPPIKSQTELLAKKRKNNVFWMIGI